jgi:hypothetical protein
VCVWVGGRGEVTECSLIHWLYFDHKTLNVILPCTTHTSTHSTLPTHISTDSTPPAIRQVRALCVVRRPSSAQRQSSLHRRLHGHPARPLRHGHRLLGARSGTRACQDSDRPRVCCACFSANRRCSWWAQRRRGCSGRVHSHATFGEAIPTTDV